MFPRFIIIIERFFFLFGRMSLTINIRKLIYLFIIVKTYIHLCMVEHDNVDFENCVKIYNQGCACKTEEMWFYFYNKSLVLI